VRLEYTWLGGAPALDLREGRRSSLPRLHDLIPSTSFQSVAGRRREAKTYMAIGDL
jgi:hypothetical protein